MLRLKPNFAFGTKAESLNNLKNFLKKSVIPGFRYFTFSEWCDRRPGVIAELQNALGDQGPIIIRSSAVNEDGGVFAQAGAFLSIPHIQLENKSAVGDAVDKVFESYASSQGRCLPEDQVLVQRMIEHVSISGVVFTVSLSTGAPYYVINYDDVSGSTDSVTSGTGYANRTLYIYRDRHTDMASERFRALLDAVTELEELTGNTALDIEFALDNDLNVHLFQVRRITTQPNWSRGLSLRIGDAIARAEKSIGLRLVGDEEPQSSKTILGKMPDWNPAEIIGNAPRHLAFSLYRYLITDSAWRIARSQMGYSEPRGRNLMEACAGQPFVNVRHSFRSFLPNNLSSELSERLVDHWLTTLVDDKTLHDKVEFDVALTCWSFDFPERAERLLPSDLSDDEKNETEVCFKELTKRLLEGKEASIGEQLKRLKELERRYNRLVADEVHKPTIELVSELLEDAIEFGTIPFAILARHGFIARQMLLSLVERKLLDRQDLEAFNRSVNTVAGDFLDATNQFARGEILRGDIMRRFGHLRPSTYDILSLRYDQRDAAIFGEAGGTAREVATSGATFKLDKHREDAISELLAHEGFEITAADFFKYCAEAIEGREWGKFVFSRSISDALEVIAAWGVDEGLSREELSHVDIRDILDSLVEARGRSTEERLRGLSESGKRDYEVTSGIRLPHLITRISDLHVIPMLLEEPNFVTLKKVSGKCIQVGVGEIDPATLDDHIVAIESADPGFDWIFARSIKGLVTRFGGANSHMAIRCAEFGIPAAIGCGEQIFERLVRSEYVEIDCAGGTIQPVGHA